MVLYHPPGAKIRIQAKPYPLAQLLTLTILILSGCTLTEIFEQPAAPKALIGTEWTLTSLNGQPLIAGTEINLYFEAAFLGGVMSCNQYGGGPDSGRYVATNDGDLTLGPIAVTVMACPTPAGVMEQEATYLEVLQSAASYRVEDEQLIIANASSETILIFAS